MRVNVCNMNQKLRLIGAALILLTSFSTAATQKLTVYAVNYPLAYFAQRIGGEHTEVVFPLPKGIDPAFWQPDAKDITGFQQADLVLLNGAGYAKWLQQVSLPRRKLVNTSADFKADYISVEQAVTHQHGPGGEHSHAGTAFTTWLDFSQAIQQASAIKSALVKQRPELEDDFRHNFVLLERELNGLDQALMAMVNEKFGRLFMASHPVYQYLARRYNISLESVMWEPDVLPGRAQWAELKQKLESHKAKWMIWEARPDPRSVEQLQALGLASLVFTPCANTPDEGDFISVMKNNIIELDKAFRR